MSDKLIRFLQKIKIRNIGGTVQVYCSKEYHGYYIRGSVLEEGGYRIVEFALINKASFRANDGDHYENEVFGSFDTATIDQFLKEQESLIYKKFIETYPDKVNQARKLCKTQRTFPQLKEILERLNDPVEINIKDLEIAESPYLKLSIKNKCEYILLKEFVFPRIGKLNNHIYPLLTDQSYDDNPLVRTELRGIIPGNNSANRPWFNFQTQKQYESYLYDIRILSDVWLEKHKVSKKEMHSLNNLYEVLKNKEDPYKEYYLSLLNDLIADLRDNKIIGQCSRCKNFFKYFRTKKYCSKESDGKDCGKSVHNKKYYEENIDKILPKARAYAKKYRAE